MREIGKAYNLLPEDLRDLEGSLNEIITERVKKLIEQLNKNGWNVVSNNPTQAMIEYNRKQVGQIDLTHIYIYNDNNLEKFLSEYSIE